MERVSWRDTVALSRTCSCGCSRVSAVLHCARDRVRLRRARWSAARRGSGGGARGPAGGRQPPGASRRLRREQRRCRSRAGSRSSCSCCSSIWSWRSGHNARALRRTGERESPAARRVLGGSCRSCRWVLPYLVVSDLWRSSEPASPRRAPNGAGSRARSSCAAGGCASWAASCCTALALWLAISGRVDVGRGRHAARPWCTRWRRSARSARDPRGARDHAAPAGAGRETDGHQLRAPAVPARGSAEPGEAGWYRDPNGAFEQRYWDGDAWTERVRREGEAQHYAPVVPAAWYPDPTGPVPVALLDRLLVDRAREPRPRAVRRPARLTHTLRPVTPSGLTRGGLSRGGLRRGGLRRGGLRRGGRRAWGG